MPIRKTQTQIQLHSGVGTQRQTDYTFISILYFTSFTAVLNCFESCAYVACITHSVVLYTGFCIWYYGFYVKSHRIYLSLHLCGCQLLTIQFSILSTSVCPAFLLASTQLKCTSLQHTVDTHRSQRHARTVARGLSRSHLSTNRAPSAYSALLRNNAKPAEL